MVTTGTYNPSKRETSQERSTESGVHTGSSSGHSRSTMAHPPSPSVSAGPGRLTRASTCPRSRSTPRRLDMTRPYQSTMVFRVGGRPSPRKEASRFRRLPKESTWRSRTSSNADVGGAAPSGEDADSGGRFWSLKSSSTSSSETTRSLGAPGGVCQLRNKTPDRLRPSAPCGPPGYLTSLIVAQSGHVKDSGLLYFTLLPQQTQTPSHTRVGGGAEGGGGGTPHLTGGRCRSFSGPRGAEDGLREETTPGAAAPPT